ncbi:MAG: BON domain-containing protein [Planctomycetota bacterium]
MQNVHPLRSPFPPLVAAVTAASLTLALPAQDAAAPEDADIREAIVDEFVADPAVPAFLIDVQAMDGIVTLQGTSDNILAKERAAAIARTVKGVRAVVDRVRVVPPADLDATALRDDVRQALIVDPATDAFEVRVSVDDAGEVTLNGKVQSWAERSLCGTVARSVAGVTEVDNAITVDFTAARADAEIRSEIAQRLRWDMLIDDGLVDVVCVDGEVALSGVVGSAAERMRARNAAWVAGVAAVDDDGLEVRGWARDAALRGSKYAVRSDEQIADAVEAALLQDPRVASFDVATEVDGGAVTLRGKVDNLMARRAAAADARNTVGVVTVRNRIAVEPTAARSGVAIERAVRDALRRDPYVDRFDVRVDVRNGMAHLYGAVDTDFERARADDVTSRVLGVVGVDNHLEVGDPHITSYDPYVDPWPVHDYDWYHYSPVVTFTADAEIRQCIEDQLWWSPFVDSEQVDVAVDDGTVTLTGTVDSRAERIAATENAYDGGAVWVVNRLELAPPGGQDE